MYNGLAAARVHPPNKSIGLKYFVEVIVCYNPLVSVSVSASITIVYHPDKHHRGSLHGP